MNRAQQGVVEVREGYLAFCSDGLTDDDLVDVAEHVPVLVEIVHSTVQWLELRATGDGHTESLSDEERLLVEEVALS